MTTLLASARGAHGFELIASFVVAGVILFVLLMILLGVMFQAARVPPTRLRKVRMKWEPRDLWIGCYWTRDPVVRIYVCVVPCVVVIFEEKD